MANASNQLISEVACIVASNGGAVPLSTRGVPSRFSNNFWEGTACFVHRLPDGSVAEQSHSELLDISGPPASMCELQIQGRFKVMPQGPVLCGCELRDGPMQLGIFTRVCARVVLMLAKSMALKRGVDIRYALGNEGDGQKPHMAGPIVKSTRMFRSDIETPLPVMWPGKAGTWHIREGKFEPIDRGPDFFDTTHWFTFVINTANVNFHCWKAVHIPALKPLDLGLFWGAQSCHSIFFDEGGKGGSRRYFFEMEVMSPQNRNQAAPSSEKGLQEELISRGTYTPDNDDVLFEGYFSNYEEGDCEDAEQQNKKQVSLPKLEQDNAVVEAPNSCLKQNYESLPETEFFSTGVTLNVGHM